jgi:hypothetical protein
METTIAWNHTHILEREKRKDKKKTGPNEKAGDERNRN